MLFAIRFQFDTKGVPPAIVIHDTKSGDDVLEIFEEPICKLGGKLVSTSDNPVDVEWQGPWSWNPEDWKAPAFSQWLLDMLNESSSEWESGNAPAAES